MAEREDNLEDENDDSEGDEEPFGLRVEVGDPVDYAEHYRGLDYVERHLNNLFRKEESVCSIHSIEVFPEKDIWFLLCS